MIIQSIIVDNFLCYYGETEFSFEDGPTIIIGQNNTGKSKLFDAFNWVLFDKAYNTNEEQWYGTKDIRENLINSQAKAECQAGHKISTSVKLHFKDTENNRYLLVKSLEATKVSDNEWDCPSIAEVILTIRESDTSNTKNLYDRDAITKVLEIFPNNLAKYFLFQGESISQIMSLSDKSGDFARALKDLSRIEVFKTARRKSFNVMKRLKKEFTDKEESNSEAAREKARLNELINYMEEQISDLEEELANHEQEHSIAKNQYIEKNAELAQFEETARILEEIKKIEGDIADANQNRDSIIGLQIRSVFDKWQYAGTDSLINQFSELYHVNKIKNNIPEPIRQWYVKEMLEGEKCKICGNQAKKGSDAYEHIESHLNEKSLDAETELINQLASTADTIIARVTDIPSELDEHYDRIDKANGIIKNYRDLLAGKESQLENTIPEGISADEIRSRNFKQLKRDRNVLRDERDRLQTLIDQKKGNISSKQESKKSAIKLFQEIIDRSENVLEKEKYSYGETIHDKISQFYEKFLERIFDDIESEANDHFHKMTKDNPALSGAVVVDRENRDIYPIDEDGHRQHNINQANKVSLQISFVAAIISVSNKFWDTTFPFIADAPISALGGNNKITAIEAMMDIFQQSILMIKDDVNLKNEAALKNDLVRKLIKSDDAIKNAYELRMIGESIQSQKTEVIRIK